MQKDGGRIASVRTDHNEKDRESFTTMKHLASRLVALVLMMAVTMGATVAFGVPHYAYAYEEAADAPVMMTVNGEDVRKAEYAASFAYCKAYMENYMGMMGADTSTMWGTDEAVAQLRTLTDNQIIYTRVLVQKFNELGLKLDRATQRQIADNKKALIESRGGEVGYQYWLATLGLTDTDYDNINLILYYLDKIDDYYYGENGAAVPSEAELRQKFEDTYYKARHILLSLYDETGMPISEAEQAEKEALAQELASRAQAGEDFEALMKKYSEDTSNSATTEGFSFTEGQMVDEFFNAASALDMNGISDAVKTSYGWHIIQRVALADADYEQYRDAIVAESVDETSDEMVNRWCSEAEVSYPDGHDTLTMADVLG